MPGSEVHRQKRAKNLLLLGVLVLFSVLIYGLTLVKMVV